MYQHMQAAEVSKQDPGAANQQQVQASVRYVSTNFRQVFLMYTC
jgi:hypothetical protein